MSLEALLVGAGLQRIVGGRSAQEEGQCLCYLDPLLSGGGRSKDKAREVGAEVVRKAEAAGRVITPELRTQVTNVVERAIRRIRALPSSSLYTQDDADADRMAAMSLADIQRQINRIEADIAPGVPDHILAGMRDRLARFRGYYNARSDKEAVIDELRKNLTTLLNGSDIRTIPEDSEDVISYETIPSGSRMVDLSYGYTLADPKLYTKKSVDTWKASRAAQGLPFIAPHTNAPVTDETEYIAHVEGQPRPNPELGFKTTPQGLNVIQKYLTEPLKRVLRRKDDVMAVPSQNPLYGHGKEDDEKKKKMAAKLNVPSDYGFSPEVARIQSGMVEKQAAKKPPVTYQPKVREIFKKLHLEGTGYGKWTKLIRDVGNYYKVDKKLIRKLIKYNDEITAMHLTPLDMFNLKKTNVERGLGPHIPASARRIIMELDIHEFS